MTGRINQLAFGLGVAVFALTALLTCSSIPELKVHYLLPEQSDQLEGKKLVLSIKDARKEDDIIKKVLYVDDSGIIAIVLTVSVRFSYL